MNKSSDGCSTEFASSFPKILLASDDSRAAESYRQKLISDGFTVALAIGYHSARQTWQQHRCPVILLDVADARSVDAAVEVAIAIKRHDPAQFVGYLADPILRTSGLAGDAIFPRSAPLLPQALRNHFAQQP